MPLPADGRRPTGWERFPRAHPEDAEREMRLQRVGWSLYRGWRPVLHPVRHPVCPAPRGVSVRAAAAVGVSEAVPGAGRVRAVLFDRDGTLVHDVPYNGDPDRVRLVDGARAAVDRLRAAGVRVGLVSNQSGVARGLLTREDVLAVNERLQELLGRLDTVQFCPHGDDDGCGCRKPAPGMVLAAARELGVAPHEVVVIGDIGADVEAARAAGATAVLVPTPATRPEEVAAAPVVAANLAEAVELALSGGHA